MARRVFIEAGSLAEARTSGIGNVVLNIVRFLANNTIPGQQYEIVLIVAFNKAFHLKKYEFPESVKVRKVYVPGKVLNLVVKLNLLPPMDIFFGKGVYIFPNFKNWPLLFSKSITYIHDVTFMRYPRFIEPKNLAFLSTHINQWLRRSEKIITVSEYSKKEIEHFFPVSRGRVSVLLNGVDIKLFRPLDTDQLNSVAQKYGLSGKSYYIFLSNIEPRKNVMRLLEAYRTYCHGQEDTPALLLVGGVGWNNRDILKEIEKMRGQGLNVIRPNSFVPDEDLPALLGGSVGLIHPAIYEGFGMSPLQAMACGKNVAVGDNSSLPEVVGDTGHYFDENNTKDIVAAFAWLVAAQKKRNDKGIKRAQAFVWEKTLAPLGDILGELSDARRN